MYGGCSLSLQEGNSHSNPARDAALGQCPSLSASICGWWQPGPKLCSQLQPGGCRACESRAIPRQLRAAYVAAPALATSPIPWPAFPWAAPTARGRAIPRGVWGPGQLPPPHFLPFPPAPPLARPHSTSSPSDPALTSSSGKRSNLAPARSTLPAPSCIAPLPAAGECGEVGERIAPHSHWRREVERCSPSPLHVPHPGPSCVAGGRGGVRERFLPPHPPDSPAAGSRAPRLGAGGVERAGAGLLHFPSLPVSGGSLPSSDRAGAREAERAVPGPRLFLWACGPPKSAPLCSCLPDPGGEAWGPTQPPIRGGGCCVGHPNG
ncbi:translation initiation factor IF-2-like [Mauremys reevesii]|uniref:translation initiation factor IF-2-like n=1 Tax=Mauremys reevesii TaxID=260615 RepID=UPI00193F9D0D|nr:translation initiation factor IF-2-like [Mauremys reevesii]